MRTGIRASLVVAALALTSSLGGSSCGSDPKEAVGGRPGVGDGSAGDASQGLDGSGCWQGSTVCSGVCVDLSSDPKNCGICGQACSAGEVCSLGKCGTSCAPGTSACGGSCLDLTKDPMHCGSCTTPCPINQVCSASKCVLGCPTGKTTCGGSCVDLATDSSHCGTCTTSCAIGTCVGGHCQCNDGTLDGTESDVDCGGSCAPCSETKTCKTTSDCQSPLTCLTGSCWRAPPIDSDLVGYWRLEGDGKDSSGNGHDGVVTQATATAGKVGQALTFASGACVGVPDSSMLDLVGVSKLGFMAWIKVTGDCAPADHGIILNKESTYEFGIQCSGANLFREAIQLSDGLWVWNGSGPITVSTWQHVALSWDGITVRHYVNGSEVYTRPLSGSFADRSSGLGIGCRNVDAAGSLATAGAWFIGAIDEVALYKRALSVSEISAYYNATK